MDFADAVPFMRSCGIDVVVATRELVRGRMPWTPEKCTVGGALHGGALMAFGDTLGAICAFLNLPEGASTSTLESKTNFFRPVRRGQAHGTTRPLHVGRTTIVVQTDVRDDEGNLVAQVTQTQAVLRPGS